MFYFNDDISLQIYCRSSVRTLIKIDDSYYFNTNLVFKDSAKNGILGRDMLAAQLIEKAHLEKNIYRRDKILDDIIYLYLTADKILMNEMVMIMIIYKCFQNISNYFKMFTESFIRQGLCYFVRRSTVEKC